MRNRRIIARTSLSRDHADGAEVTDRVPYPHQIALHCGGCHILSRDIQHPSQQGEIRGTRSPGALCTNSCPALQQAVPNQSHNAVILSRVPRSPSRYGTSLSHVRPEKERTRPGLPSSHPTIVPLTRNPIPLQARPVPHCKAPGVCPTLSGGCPLWCAASDAPIRGAPGPGLSSTQLQGPWKPVLLRARRA